jgi:hypothetical protein
VARLALADRQAAARERPQGHRRTRQTSRVAAPTRTAAILCEEDEGQCACRAATDGDLQWLPGGPWRGRAGAGLQPLRQGVGALERTDGCPSPAGRWPASWRADPLSDPQSRARFARRAELQCGGGPTERARHPHRLVGCGQAGQLAAGCAEQPVSDRAHRDGAQPRQPRAGQGAGAAALRLAGTLWGQPRARRNLRRPGPLRRRLLQGRELGVRGPDRGPYAALRQWTGVERPKGHLPLPAARQVVRGTQPRARGGAAPTQLGRQHHRLGRARVRWRQDLRQSSAQPTVRAGSRHVRQTRHRNSRSYGRFDGQDQSRISVLRQRARGSPQPVARPHRGDPRPGGRAQRGPRGTGHQLAELHRAPADYRARTDQHLQRQRPGDAAAPDSRGDARRDLARFPRCAGLATHKRRARRRTV